MVIPSFVLDSERRVVVWNKALEALTGIAASDVLGTQDHWRGFYDHQRPCLADLLYDEGSGGGEQLYVSQTNGAATNARSKMAQNWCTMPIRGEKRFLVIDASAITDAEGQLLAVVETLRDTTAEQEAKNALVAQREAQEQSIADQLEAACRDMSQALSALSDGDLTYRINTAMPGVIDQLRDSFNAAMNEMEQVVGQTTATAATVSNGSDEIAASADELSHRTEQQAANLEETAAALTQIMETVKRTADGAAHARDVVASTRDEVSRSGQIVHEAVAAMDKVEGSSREIGQIVGVIDEIAFQTNLLALNAGVEAARAGEVGRGFAVVAAEVRALAQRSAESAKEIKKLMMDSASHVQHGVDLVGQAGRALTRVVKQIADIDTVVAEFAQATKDQATGLTEINTAVAQMDKVTQQNAGMVQQTSAIGQDLRQETAELQRVLQRFRVGQEPAISRPLHSIAKAATGTTANRSAPVARLQVVRTGGRAAADPGWQEF